MSLKLYHLADSDTEIKTYSPFRITFNGSIGGQLDQKIYIRNDDPERYYQDISVLAVDTSGSGDLTDNSRSGYFWKLAEKDIPLTKEEWDLISFGNTLSLSSDIGSSEKGDIVTYLPIWVKVSVPSNQAATNITDLSLRVLATEIVVDG